MATKPEAVLIASSGTPANIAESTLKRRGYVGMIYQTHSATNSDFLHLDDRTSPDDTTLPAGAVLVVNRLRDAASKVVAQQYVKEYMLRYPLNTMSAFGAHLYDAMILMREAIPSALAKSAPGSVEFRVALRDALEAPRDVVLTSGIAKMSRTDHSGLVNPLAWVFMVSALKWQVERIEQ
jgi:branched-chain amino acid transport system substrate-binding protein